MKYLPQGPPLAPSLAPSGPIQLWQFLLELLSEKVWDVLKVLKTKISFFPGSPRSTAYRGPESNGSSSSLTQMRWDRKQTLMFWLNLELNMTGYILCFMCVYAYAGCVCVRGGTRISIWSPSFMKSCPSGMCRKSKIVFQKLKIRSLIFRSLKILSRWLGGGGFGRISQRWTMRNSVVACATTTTRTSFRKQGGKGVNCCCLPYTPTLLAEYHNSWIRFHT